jgi:hypothetical protein
MNAAQKLAAALKDRKNISPGTGRNDPLARAPPNDPLAPAPRPIGYGSSTGPTIARLKQELRSANARAAKAETKLAALQAKIVARPWGRIKEMTREIQRLRADAKEAAVKLRAAARVRLKPMRRLDAAWKRIEALEAENEQLRDHKRRHGDWQATRLSLQALLLQHPKAGVISIRAAAAAVGVDPRLVDKWLRGDRRPKPEMQELIAAWVRTNAESLKEHP